MLSKNVDFFFSFYEKGSFPAVYSSISLHQGKSLNIEALGLKSNLEKPGLYSIFFIPNYIRPKIDDQRIRVRKVEQFFKGYALDLADVESADSYIRERFRKNAKTIRKRVRRLESSFNINYQMYYGSIDKDRYDYLIEMAYAMIVRRFQQKKDKSHTLNQWDKYKKSFFDSINQKRASMFVIYDENKPIAISLGYHAYEMHFSLVSAYDIDYSKFSLGNVEIYKKIDWLLQNNHCLYELGMGDLPYKREWSNIIYNFEHQIIFPKKGIKSWFYGNLLFYKVSLRESLFRMAYVPYKKFQKRLKKQSLPFEAEQYISTPFTDDEDLNTYTKLDIESKDNVGLREYVYNFLYSNREHKEQVSLMRSSKVENTFLIKGNRTMQKITLKSPLK